MVKITKKGLTLVELIVVIAIMGGLMLGVQLFFSSGLKFFRISQAKMEIQRDARQSLSQINRKLREASAKSVIVSRYDDDQPPWSMIYFETVDNEKYRFYQHGTKLYMNDLIRGSTRQLAERLRHITFCYPMLPDEDIMSISLCFEKYTRTPEAKSLQLSVEKVRIMNE